MSLAATILVTAVATATILTDATADAFDLSRCERRQYEARARRCKDDKNYLEIYNMTTNAPFDPTINRHNFYRNQKTSFCISGRATGITAPVPSLQVAVHSVGFLFIVPVRQSHCNVERDACKVMKPPCGSTGLGPHALYPGQEVCACIEAKIPNYARAGIDVTVTFNLLGVDGELDGKCEKEQDNAKLRAKRKEKLLCMELNGIIKPEEDDNEQVRPVRKEDEEDIDYLNYENYPDDDSRE